MYYNNYDSIIIDTMHAYMQKVNFDEWGMPIMKFDKQNIEESWAFMQPRIYDTIIKFWWEKP